MWRQQHSVMVVLMIRFDCHCGNVLEIPQSLAGQSVQCVACGRLRSVPELEDLPNLQRDGTFAITDSRWQERQPTIPAPSPNAAPGSSSAAASTPLRPVRVLPYSHTRPDRPSEPYIPERIVRWWTLPLDLFQPANASVLGIVFLVHLFAQFLALFAMAGVFPFWLLVIVIGLLLICHLGNVLDDTGPEGRDELPTVLRNAEWEDDLMRPFSFVLLAVGICFGPAIVLVHLLWNEPLAGDPATWAALGALLVLGIVSFPVVWLTVVASGTYLNLSPPRLLGMFSRAPVQFLLAIALLPIALGTYVLSLGLVYEFSRTFVAGVTPLLPFSLPRWLLACSGYGLLFFAIYAWHLLAWLLGKTYQDHHEQFPWVWQRHEKNRTTAEPARRLPQRLHPPSPTHAPDGFRIAP